MVSVATGSVISAFARMLPFLGAAEVGEMVPSFTMFAIVFAAILKVMPDVRLRWSNVWAGGLFVAVLLVIGKFLIAIYLAHAGKASAYGAAGSLAVILLLTYYSALIFLLRIELTQGWVRNQDRESRQKRALSAWCNNLSAASRLEKSNGDRFPSLSSERPVHR